MIRISKKLKKATKKPVPPSSYKTMPYYFPTEQIDIVRKMKLKRPRKKKIAS